MSPHLGGGESHPLHHMWQGCARADSSLCRRAIVLACVAMHVGRFAFLVAPFPCLAFPSFSMLVCLLAQFVVETSVLAVLCVNK